MYARGRRAATAPRRRRRPIAPTRQRGSRYTSFSRDPRARPNAAALPATTNMGFCVLLLLVCSAGASTLAWADPAVKPISVHTVGDSITVADGDDCYPNQLQALLGAGYNVTNQGVSGHTMLNSGLCAATPAGSWRRPCLDIADAKPCSGNCSYWATPQYQAVLGADPDIITIMLGTNDAKGCNWFGPPNGSPAGAGTQFAADYTRMIKTFKALPSHPKVYVVLPPPGISQCTLTGPMGNASICLAYNMSFHAINEVFPVLQRQIAKDAGADGVIDVWSALNGTACTKQPAGAPLQPARGGPCPHTADGIHPYSDAMATVAQTIAKGIGAVL